MIRTAITAEDLRGNRHPLEESDRNVREAVDGF